jgi:hypothetical protein
MHGEDGDNKQNRRGNYFHVHSNGMNGGFPLRLAFADELELGANPSALTR